MPPPAGSTILVVDDEEAIRGLMVRALASKTRRPHG